MSLIAHDGRAQTISAWAREAGLPIPTLYQRLRNGWLMEAALVPFAGRARDPELEHDGRTQRLTEWARELRIRAHVLEVRLANGWSVARALTTPTGTARR